MSAAGGSSESTDRSAPRLTTHVLGIAIFAITGMQLMSTLDGTIVIVALPRLQAELDLSDAGKSWVITAYVLTFGGLLLIGGRIGDAIGHKRAFLSGVGVFTIASLVCAAWPPTASPSSSPGRCRAPAPPSPRRPGWL
jgi:MFS family permease